MMNGPIFNKKALARLQTPDDLDRYLKVPNPGIWVTLFALCFLLLGLLLWSLLGSLSHQVMLKGVRRGDTVMCLTDKETAEELRAGDPANIEGVLYDVADVAVWPISKENAQQYVGSEVMTEYMMEDMAFAYPVTLQIKPGQEENFPDDTPLAVWVSAGNQAPITLLTGE